MSLVLAPCLALSRLAAARAFGGEIAIISDASGLIIGSGAAAG
jgi:hypothetical protein